MMCRWPSPTALDPITQLEHRAILDAYLRRDPEAAARAVEAHIKSSIHSLEFDPGRIGEPSYLISARGHRVPVRQGQSC